MIAPAIAVTDVTLALSFGLPAIIPVALREFAFATLLGVLLDTFVVRSVPPACGEGAVHGHAKLGSPILHGHSRKHMADSGS